MKSGMNLPRLVGIALVTLSTAHAVSIQQSTISLTADEQTCTLGRPQEVFQPSVQQVFFGFIGLQIRPGEEVLIEWVDPKGDIAQATPYEGLPTSAKLCFLTQLPIAGFDAADKPGKWLIQVSASGRVIHKREFQIADDPNRSLLHISRVERAISARGTELSLTGAGFEATSVIHIAQYTATGGWKYLYRLEPTSSRSGQLKAVQTGTIPTGEYIVIVRNADNRMSQPARMLIASDVGYKLPLAAGEPWMITQGPYGGFSHFSRTSQAWDIAPIGDLRKCVVAMRGGVAYTFDGGWRQTQHIRSFGNYITIAHDNGEFSHYGHLSTGTFQVANGQRVEQGQALAVVGNSGYTFGAGGGHHIHVQITREFSISAPSIPFRFDDLPDPLRSGHRTVISKNSSPLCNCAGAVAQGKRAAAQTVTAAAVKGNKLAGAVQVEQWWTQVLLVSPRSNLLEVSLSWKAEGRDLNLHLISPTGKHYGPHYSTEGYSAVTGAEKISLNKPEAGYWRVSVRGMQGPPGEIQFEVESSAALAKLASR